MISRALYHSVWQELASTKAMVFMAGPRQAGKTTLAQAIAGEFADRDYLNWDIASDRNRLLSDPYYFAARERHATSAPMVVFDEIHKYRNWKNYLKGAYDRYHDEYRFLVTGSGRLDTYRKGGDSLAGRYSLFHLWPLTLAELLDRRASLEGFLRDPLAIIPDEGGAAKSAWLRLSSFSGFPEPYALADASSYRRWSTAYHSQLVREDIRDLTGITALGDVETLFRLLPGRVGSLLSATSLSEDLKVSYNTVRAWLGVLESFYVSFSIAPWTRGLSRATQKARKTYLFDYALIEDPAARFENMVALELFRAVSTWNDLGRGSFELHFVRNRQGHEVDFLIVEKRRPLLLVEAKAADTQPAPALRTFQEKLGVPAVQLTAGGDTYRRFPNGSQEVLIAPVHMWVPRLT